MGQGMKSRPSRKYCHGDAFHEQEPSLELIALVAPATFLKGCAFWLIAMELPFHQHDAETVKAA